MENNVISALLTSDSHESCLSALKAIAAINEPVDAEIKKHVVACLEDGSPSVTMEAVSIVASWVKTDPVALLELYNVYRNGRYPCTRNAAAKYLANKTFIINGGSDKVIVTEKGDKADEEHTS